MTGNAATRILVTEDDPDIGALLGHYLRKAGFDTTVLLSGRDVMPELRRELPDLVILDLMMPGMSGLELCRAIRADASTAAIPIIMLTAKSEESDRIVGLEVGADDYITKPFSLRELAARVRAMLRRGLGDHTRKEISPLVYRGKHLVADFDAVAVSVDGDAVRLTRREFELLRYLVENRNRVLSRDRLLERVWGYDRFVETRSVDVHVGRLRGKLGTAGRQIETVVGLGYRFVEIE
jgi:DNA-binding response OmpR family regulator